MKTYEILTVPHPVLKTKSAPVERVDEGLQAQLSAMLETMYEGKGIGLAANQVGITNRVLVMDLQKRGEDGEDIRNPILCVNPKIVRASEERSTMEEGCLSIPRHYVEVERAARVTVEYLDFNGKQQTLEADGLLSHCVQHEIDHLDGVLILDYISAIRRNMIVRKVEKMKRGAEIL